MNSYGQCSVIIPVFNRDNLIERAVNSVQQQEGVEFEIIVVDDGSTDRSGEVARSCCRSVKLITLPQNAGPSCARNIGAETASFSFISFLDSDDQMPRGYLYSQLEFLHENPAVQLVYSKVVRVTPSKTRVVSKRFNSNEEALVVLCHDGNFSYTPSSWVLRRSLWNSAVCFDPKLRTCEDRDFLMRLLVNEIPVAHNRATYVEKFVQPDSALASPTHLANVLRQHIYFFRSFKSSNKEIRAYSVLGRFRWIKQRWYDLPKALIPFGSFLLFEWLNFPTALRIKSRIVISNFKCFKKGQCFTSPLESLPRETGGTLRKGKKIKLLWFYGFINAGDALSPLIVHALSGRPIHSVLSLKKRRPPCFLALGSILQRMQTGDIVWGSGSWVFDRNKFASRVKGVNSVTFHAVRGPLTRELLTSFGFDVPAVYGDPAIVMPYLYNKPYETPTFDLGIVCHKNDISAASMWEGARIRQISLQRPPLEVIDDILTCKMILSSSLHGIILAETYGIPCAWHYPKRVDWISPEPVEKYYDYFYSTNRSPESMELPSKLDLDQIYGACMMKPDLSKLRESLLEAFPFPNEAAFRTLLGLNRWERESPRARPKTYLPQNS